MKRYIEDMESDVITPEDLMDALTYDGGIRNTAIEFIKLNRDNGKVRDYVTAIEEGLMGKLGSPAEIVYEQRYDWKLSITCYLY